MIVRLSPSFSQDAGLADTRIGMVLLNEIDAVTHRGEFLDVLYP